MWTACAISLTLAPAKPRRWKAAAALLKISARFWIVLGSLFGIELGLILT